MACILVDSCSPIEGSMDFAHDKLDCDKVSIRALNSLISSYQNRSSRVLRSDMETFVLFFKRLLDFKELSLLFFLCVII